MEGQQRTKEGTTTTTLLLPAPFRTTATPPPQQEPEIREPHIYIALAREREYMACIGRFRSRSTTSAAGK